MFCDNCGAELSKEAKFCASCGTKIANSIVQTPSTQTIIEPSQQDAQSILTPQVIQEPQSNPAPQNTPIPQATVVPQAEPIIQNPPPPVSQSDKVAQVISALQNKSSSDTLPGAQSYTPAYKPTVTRPQTPGYNQTGFPVQQQASVQDNQQRKAKNPLITIISVVAGVIALFAIVIFVVNPIGSGSSPNPGPAQVPASASAPAGPVFVSLSDISELKLPAKDVNTGDKNKIDGFSVLDINTVNGVKVTRSDTIDISLGDSLRLIGWAGDALAKIPASKVYLIIGDKGINCYENRMERPDVGEYYKNPSAKDFGFSITIPAETIANNQKIGFAIISADGTYRYKQIEYNISWK